MFLCPSAWLTQGILNPESAFSNNFHAPRAGLEPTFFQLCTYRLEGVANTGAYVIHDNTDHNFSQLILA